MALPQLDVPDLVDAPCLTFSKELMGGGVGEVEGKQEGREGELWLICKMKKK